MNEPTQCTRLDELLGPYLDGELPDEEAEMVAAHVVSCAACSRQLEELRGLGAVLRMEDPPAVEADEWDRRWSAIRDQVSQPPRSRLTPNPTTGFFVRHARSIGVIASAAVVLFALVFAFYPSEQPVPVEPSTACVVEAIEDRSLDYMSACHYSEEAGMTVIRIVALTDDDGDEEETDDEESMDNTAAPRGDEAGHARRPRALRRHGFS